MIISPRLRVATRLSNLSFIFWLIFSIRTVNARTGDFEGCLFLEGSKPRGMISFVALKVRESVEYRPQCASDQCGLVFFFLLAEGNST